MCCKHTGPRLSLWAKKKLGWANSGRKFITSHDGVIIRPQWHTVRPFRPAPGAHSDRVPSIEGRHRWRGGRQASYRREDQHGRLCDRPVSGTERWIGGGASIVLFRAAKRPDFGIRTTKSAACFFRRGRRSPRAEVVARRHGHVQVWMGGWTRAEEPAVRGSHGKPISSLSCLAPHSLAH